MVVKELAYISQSFWIEISSPEKVYWFNPARLFLSSGGFIPLDGWFLWFMAEQPPWIV